MALAVVARASPLHGKGPAKVLHRLRWLEKDFPWPGNPKPLKKLDYFEYLLFLIWMRWSPECDLCIYDISIYIYTCIFRCFTSRHEVSWLCCTFLYAHSAKAQICHIISLAWDEGLGHTFQICFHKIWIEDIDPDRCQKVKKKRRTSRRLMPSMLLLCVVPRDLKH